MVVYCRSSYFIDGPCVPVFWRFSDSLIVRFIRLFVCAMHFLFFTTLFRRKKNIVRHEYGKCINETESNKKRTVFRIFDRWFDAFQRSKRKKNHDK